MMKHRLHIFRSHQSRSRFTSTFTLSCLAAILLSLAPIGTQAAVGPSFIRPLISSAENSTTTWGRDGGYSVPLPNGKDFWIFGDTPLYQLKSKKWYMTDFISGSTSGVIGYKLGQSPKGRFNESAPGGIGATATAKPKHFLANPKLYMPDSSGRPCTKAVAGPTTESVRWPNGAILMPDKTNILISYLGNCGYGQSYNVETWGFALYNWKTNKFTTPPFDVFPSNTSGKLLAEGKNFGSPVLVNNQITFYSWDNNSLYSATVLANLAALKNPASYKPKPIPGVATVFPISVSGPSSTQPHLTMYQLVDYSGKYRLLSAPKPQGPWTQIGTSVLPGCDKTAPHYCFTISLHPEISKKGQLLATYYLPGARTGLSPNNYPVEVDYFGHIVMSYLPD